MRVRSKNVGSLIQWFATGEMSTALPAKENRNCQLHFSLSLHARESANTCKPFLFCSHYEPKILFSQCARVVHSLLLYLFQNMDLFLFFQLPWLSVPTTFILERKLRKGALFPLNQHARYIWRPLHTGANRTELHCIVPMGINSATKKDLFA